MSTSLNSVPQKQWTADEFFHSPLSQNYELIEGELIETMPAGFIHGIVAQRVGG